MAYNFKITESSHIELRLASDMGEMLGKLYFRKQNDGRYKFIRNHLPGINEEYTTGEAEINWNCHIIFIYY